MIGDILKLYETIFPKVKPKHAIKVYTLNTPRRHCITTMAWTNGLDECKPGNGCWRSRFPKHAGYTLLVIVVKKAVAVLEVGGQVVLG